MAWTTADGALAATLEHRVGLARYGNGVLQRVIRLVNDAEKDIVRQIERRFGSGSGPVDETHWAGKRLNQLLAQIRAINAEAHAEIATRLGEGLEAQATYEGEWTGELARRVGVRGDFVTPSAARLKALVYRSPFAGGVLKDTVRRLEASGFERMKRALQIGLVQGESTDQIVRRITGSADLRYADGVTAVNRRGVERIVRTATTHINVATQREIMAANPALYRGWLFVAVLDERTSLVCMGNSGRVFPVEKGPFPPLHYYCLPGDALVASRHRITGASKRWFEGQLVVVRTASGREVACTPNHPVLTRRGWVAAGALDLTDEVICDGRGQGEALADAQDQDVEARIEDVAEAFLGSGGVRPVPMPMTAEDFHGDGADGEIAVVGTNRGLTVEDKAALLQEARNVVFQGGDPTTAALSRGLQFVALPFAPSDGLVGGGGEGAPLLRAEAGHSGELLLTPVTEAYTLLAQHAGDDVGGDPHLFGDAGHADASGEHADSGGGVDVALAGVLHGNASSGERPVHGLEVAADFVGDLHPGDAGTVQADNVVFLGRREFAGHVFNLETASGYYSTGGIVVHNCRSTILPLLASNPEDPKMRNYEQWLREQPEEVQRRILGKTRFDLWKQGGLNLKHFVDGGRAFTIAELRAWDEQAFIRAGLAKPRDEK